jgi:hypothetical protein
LARNRGIQRRDRGSLLQIQGFGALPGIAIVVACLTINQMAYLAGVFRRPSGLFQKQANKVPSRRRNNDVAGAGPREEGAPAAAMAQTNLFSCICRRTHKPGQLGGIWTAKIVANLIYMTVFLLLVDRIGARHTSM